MRLFTILALLMLPISVGQFYSTDSHANTGKIVPQKSLFNEILHNRQDSANHAYDNKELHPIKNLAKQADRKLAKKDTDLPVKPKRVNRTKGKINSQGMKLLSILLMLKDKKK